jgi:mono/diheme cytochrome c family protein
MPIGERQARLDNNKRNLEIEMGVRGSVALLAILSCGSGASAQEIGDAVAGHEFARKVCAVCHAVEADETLSSHPSAPTFTRIAAEPGMTATALSVILRNPHREMPDIILETEQRANVISYILTLKAKD